MITNCITFELLQTFQILAHDLREIDHYVQIIKFVIPKSRKIKYIATTNYQT